MKMWRKNGTMPAEATSAHRNQLANLLGSDRLLLTAVESESKAGESSFVAQDSAYYYATYSKTGVDNLQEQVSSGRTRGFTKVSHGYILDLGYCEAGEEVKVTNTANELVQLVVYRLDLMALRTAYEALARTGGGSDGSFRYQGKGKRGRHTGGQTDFFHRG